jgi:hypothetical protein|tara:strand:+ start:6321 stop:9092 length:2772 start_codon:yes stop_codon:yes gene_type:complete
VSEYIKITTIDTNLVSGSQDKTRNMIGGYWEITSSSEEDDYGDSLQYSVTPESATGTTITPEHSDEFSMYPESDWVTASATSITPNYKFPVRVIGNPSIVRDDVHWAAILGGGTYGTSSYSGIISNGTFDAHNFTMQVPYSKLDAKNITPTDYASYDYYDIKTNYQDYYPEYETYVQGLDSDLLIPNFYVLQMYEDGYPADVFDEELTDSVTAGDSITGLDPYAILKPTNLLYPPPYVVGEESVLTVTAEGRWYRDATKNTRDYLTGTLPNSELSDSTFDYISARFSNLLFNLEAQGTYDKTAMEDGAMVCAPFHVSIDIPTIAENSMQETFRESNFEDMFLSNLRAHFASSGVQSTSVENYPTTALIENDVTVSGSVIPFGQTQNVSYRSVDFLEFLLNYANMASFPALNDQYLFEPLTSKTQLLRNPAGAYRFAKSTTAFEVLGKVIAEMNTTPLTCVDDGSLNYVDFLAMAEDSDEASPLAYRIAKTNISRGAFAQNIFLSNPHPERLSYYDTQVRYGETYTYTTYAYMLVKGYNYRYTDLLGTRLIGDTDHTLSKVASALGLDLGTLTGDELRDALATAMGGSYADSFVEVASGAGNCLEFFNLSTGAATSQLYVTAENNPLVAANAFASNAQVLSENRYMADFYVSLEPSWKIMEVEVAQKTVTILDHMPAAPDVTPYQRMDDSQIIGFYVNLESFTPSVFPTSIDSVQESQYRQDYLRSYNLLDSDKIQFRSTSRAASLEVYRTDKEPTSIADFADKLVEVKDLSIARYGSTKTNCFYEEKVRTNKKYYYLFRFLNEHGISGLISPVYIAELVSDGGYKYSKFGILYETEFIQSDNTTISEPFKKIMRILPSPRHIFMDDSAVDYEQEASTQLENVKIGTGVDDTIWDTPFKVRLTSKKTGKKIDLNITYRVRESSY